MSSRSDVRRSRRRGLLLLVSSFLLGASSATWLSWPALTTYGVYHSDTRQSPHWAAYHTTSYRADDILVEYGRFNESPLQNAIYFVATWFGDSIRVGKVLSVIANGLSACLFFFLGRAMYGARAGFLAALFFTFFPPSFRFAEGFFSKFWAAPLLLLCVYLLHTGRRRGLIVLLPVAALAYPMTAVLIGVICSVHLVMLWLSDRGKARAFLGTLAIGSTLAALLLLWKYALPPEFIGPLFSRSALLDHPIGGAGAYVPIPSLTAELRDHLENPFIVFSIVGYFMVLGRRGIHWEPCWTALLLASMAAYVIADLLFVRLYVPDRYTRYSIAVLLALWHATNLDRVLAAIRRPILRHATLAAVLVAAGLSYHGTGERHFTRSGLDVVSVAAFIRTLPEGILVAGPPRYLDDITIQAKRSVLSAYKLNHGWNVGLEATLRERTLAIYDAIYAPDARAINDLQSRYGVTHLVVDRSYFGSRLREGRFRSRYDREVEERVGSRSEFLLLDPPRESVVYDDGSFIVVALPLPGAPPDPASEPRAEGAENATRPEPEGDRS